MNYTFVKKNPYKSIYFLAQIVRKYLIMNFYPIYDKFSFIFNNQDLYEKYFEIFLVNNNKNTHKDILCQNTTYYLTKLI